MKLKRITNPGCPTRGIARSTRYATADGRFEIIKMEGIETSWQARAVDGSEPFTYVLFGKVRQSSVFNADTLGECREEIAMLYEED